MNIKLESILVTCLLKKETAFALQIGNSKDEISSKYKLLKRYSF
jgi:hypothetical protein